MHTCYVDHVVSVLWIFGTMLGRALHGLRFSLSSCFSALVLFIFYFSLFSLLPQCNGSLDVTVWGLMAGLQGLLAIEVFYCLEAG